MKFEEFQGCISGHFPGRWV